MRRFTKLEGLAMGYNLLTTCPAIFTLRHLRRLDLNDNQLRTIPSALSSLTALEHLNLANNHLVALPRLLAPLSQLRTLSVHGNAALQGAPRLV
jgi:Leucine-rich repeat (LRR) protein